MFWTILTVVVFLAIFAMPIPGSMIVAIGFTRLPYVRNYFPAMIATKITLAFEKICNMFLSERKRRF